MFRSKALTCAGSRRIRRTAAPTRAPPFTRDAPLTNCGLQCANPLTQCEGGVESQPAELSPGWSTNQCATSLRDRESSHVCCWVVNVVHSPNAKGIASTARTLKAGLNDDRGRDRGFTRDDFDRMRPGRQRV
jgi:hypothetical protein